MNVKGRLLSPLFYFLQVAKHKYKKKGNKIMSEMVIFYPEDYCMNCKVEHSLEIYDVYGNHYNISNIIKDNSIIDRKELSYIKCKKCNREYNIDWSGENRIPKPLITNIALGSFLQLFKQNNNYILYK
jgi:hypothetical protein